jgi:low temperature requirement protein LtrA
MIGRVSLMGRRVHVEAVDEDASVTQVELFFDLVFVFALTQVSSLMAGDLTWRGIARGLLLLGLLWWSWTGYAWLCNLVRADEGAVRFVVLASMLTMFVLALTIPEAFDDRPGGLSGPVLVAVCYFAFRAVHLALFWLISWDDPGLRRQLLRFTPSMLGGTALLLAASQFRGGVQTGLWALALLADYGGTFLVDPAGWRLRSASHFAERHGLIVIVALGESVVAIGVGLGGLPISGPALAAAVLGLVLSAALWWAYFDVSAPLVERALATAPPDRRTGLARDAYTYLHVPMIAGIVLLAVGLKKVLGYVADTGHHHLSDPLTGIGLYALYGGVALYLATHVAFKYRAIRSVNPFRLVTAAVLLALLPLAARMPALAALGVLAALTVAMVGVETLRFADRRRQIRHA